MSTPMRSRKANVNESFHKRLEWLLDQIGISQERIAAQVGITSSGLSKLKSGASKPSETVLRQLSQVLGTSVSWLGQGQGTPQEGRDDQRLLTAEELEVLRCWRRISPELRVPVLNLLSAMAAGSAPPPPAETTTEPALTIKETEEPEDRDPTLVGVGYPQGTADRQSATALLPYLGQVSAETRPSSLDAPTDEQLEVPTSYLPEGIPQEALKTLTISGGSFRDMELEDGDLLILSEGPPEPGARVVAVIDGEKIHIRRFFPCGNRVELRPAHDAMQSISLPAHRVVIRALIVGKWHPQRA